MSGNTTHEPRIRANRYSVMTLEWPAECGELTHWLKSQCARAPALMQEIGLVLKPSKGVAADAIAEAIQSMESLQIDLIGLTGDPAHRSVANQLGLPWLSAQNITQVAEPTSRSETSVSSEAASRSSLDPAMIVQGPIRSGVQIYARDRDLIVLGQVSEGAEIMADGHVHVYGRLRGRVAAGVSGRTDANIFCQQFDPELVSIAGLYVGSEQIPSEHRSAQIRVGLDSAGNALIYSVLS